MAGRNTGRRISILTAIACAFLLFPCAAKANTPVIALMFTTGSPFFVAFSTYGVAFLIIVIIEAIVFSLMLKTGILKALLLSLKVNLISTLLGAVACVLAVSPESALILIVLAVLLWIRYKSGFSLWMNVLIVASIILFIFPAFPIGLMIFNDYNMGISWTVLVILLLLPGFGSSVVIEGIALKRLLKGADVWKTVLVANVFSYIFLIPVAVHYVKPEEYINRYLAMGGAKNTLRLIGASQYVYSRENDRHVYGSFQALKETGYIEKGYDLNNIAKLYKFSWNVNNVSTVQSEEFPSGVISTFTIIGWPTDTRPGFLNTYGISEDQTVRAFNPDGKNELDSVTSWDPIL